MEFSDRLWQKILPLYQRIAEHPFNQELACGTLDKERFQFYMQQDAAYLVEFSKALALIAARTESPADRSAFLSFSEGALNAERQLHAQFIDLSCCLKVEPSFAMLSYTHYLIATASSCSIEEAIASVLPCFWIYREVGKEIFARAHADNPYHLWINTYSCDTFSKGTDKMIAIFNQAAALSPQPLLRKMEAAFTTSTILEWQFWDDAYRMSVFGSISRSF